MLARISFTPVSSALARAIRSASRSTRTARVASSTGRAREPFRAGPAPCALRSISLCMGIDCRREPRKAARCGELTSWASCTLTPFVQTGIRTVSSACTNPHQPKRGVEMATAVVEERQLLKTLRWWDGFVIALCNPGFLLGSLGFTLGIFGATGSLILWGCSAAIGMLQAWIYSEPATMFGHRSGGISLYAHEGWRRYTTLVGPLSAFG